MDFAARTSSDAPAAQRCAVWSAIGWGASLAVVAAICGFFLSDNRPHPQPAAAAPVTPVSFDAVVAEMRDASSRPRNTAPAAPISPELRARALGEIARVDRVLRDYRRQYGEFPVGSNADITRALSGENEKRIVFVTAHEVPMNDRAELIDAWQTPYFFHQVSGTRIEIYSAGPDRQMWTADDLKVSSN